MKSQQTESGHSCITSWGGWNCTIIVFIVKNHADSEYDIHFYQKQSENVKIGHF